MKANFLLLFILYFAVISATVKSQEDQAREMLRREQAQRLNQQAGHNRLRHVNPSNPGTLRLSRLSRFKDKVYFKFDPTLTKDDIEAISVNPDDLNRFNDFLKQPKTGIIRLHSASVCPPNKMLVQADSICPINVPGKATGYSFRTDNYQTGFLSDLFFDGNKLKTTGVLTLGIFGSLGDVDIEQLSLTKDGIKQLAEFQPSNKQEEVTNHSQILAKGVEVGGCVYQTSAPVKENKTYVLRTIAYQGKVPKGIDAQRAEFFKADERKDVIVVFRVIRKHDDNSITLIWKELERKSSPKIAVKKEPQ